MSTPLTTCTNPRTDADDMGGSLLGSVSGFVHGVTKMGHATNAAFDDERFDEGSMTFDSLGSSLSSGTGTEARTTKATDGLSALREVMGNDPNATERARLALLSACLDVVRQAAALANDSQWCDQPLCHGAALRLSGKCQHVCAAASVLDVALRKESRP